jgi:hypothetical protein
MEKTAESPLKKSNQDGIITQDVPLDLVTSNGIRPRAIIFKSSDVDLRKIKEIIKAQFPKVKILYITTGPAATVLRVVKSTPFENQNLSVQPLYSIN